VVHDANPWTKSRGKLNPAFTEERLVFLAKQLLEIRAAALALQQPEKAIARGYSDAVSTSGSGINSASMR